MKILHLTTLILLTTLFTISCAGTRSVTNTPFKKLNPTTEKAIVYHYRTARMLGNAIPLNIYRNELAVAYVRHTGWYANYAPPGLTTYTIGYFSTPIKINLEAGKVYFIDWSNSWSADTKITPALIQNENVAYPHLTKLNKFEALGFKTPKEVIEASGTYPMRVLRRASRPQGIDSEWTAEYYYTASEDYYDGKPRTNDK